MRPTLVILLVSCLGAASGSLTGGRPVVATSRNVALRSALDVQRLRGGGILRFMRRAAARIGDELTCLPEEEQLSAATAAHQTAQAALAKAKNATAVAKEALKASGKALGTATKAPSKAVEVLEERLRASANRCADLYAETKSAQGTAESMAKECRYLEERGDVEGAKSMAQETDAQMKRLNSVAAKYEREHAYFRAMKAERDQLAAARAEDTDNHAPSVVEAAEKKVDQAKARLAEARRREASAKEAVAAAAKLEAEKRLVAMTARKKFREEQKQARAAQ